mgnify:CR=1 FL=1
MRTKKQLNDAAKAVQDKINDSSWLLCVSVCGFIAVVAGLALGNSTAVVCGIIGFLTPAWILSGYMAEQKALNREWYLTKALRPH